MMNYFMNPATTRTFYSFGTDLDDALEGIQFDTLEEALRAKEEEDDSYEDCNLYKFVVSEEQSSENAQTN